MAARSWLRAPRTGGTRCSCVVGRAGHRPLPRGGAPDRGRPRAAARRRLDPPPARARTSRPAAASRSTRASRSPARRPRCGAWCWRACSWSACRASRRPRRSASPAGWALASSRAGSRARRGSPPVRPGRAGLAVLLLSRLVWGALSGMEVPLAASDRGGRARGPSRRDRPVLGAAGLGLATLARPEAGLLVGLHVLGAGRWREALRRVAVAAAIVAAGGRLQPRRGRPARAGDRRRQGRGRAPRAGRGPRERLGRGGCTGDGVPRRVGGGPVPGPRRAARPRAGRARRGPGRPPPLARARADPPPDRGGAGRALPGARPFRRALLGAPPAARRRRGARSASSAFSRGLAAPGGPRAPSASLLLVGLALRLPAEADAYAWGVQNINAMQVALGRWVAARTPPDTLIALNDVGALSYFGQRRVIDLVGLGHARDPAVPPAGPDGRAPLSRSAVPGVPRRLPGVVSGARRAGGTCSGRSPR